jgi:hypothetical protein
MVSVSEAGSRVDASVGVTRTRDHRERQIAEVLVRYGLSYLANVVGLKRLVGAANGVVGRAPADACARARNPGTQRPVAGHQATSTPREDWFAQMMHSLANLTSERDLPELIEHCAGGCVDEVVAQWQLKDWAVALGDRDESRF